MENESEKWFDKNCWRNKGRLYRYFALVNICLIGLGAFVSMDSPGALQEALMKTFNINFSEFSLMFSVSSWANTVLSVFAGILVDRVFGVKFGTLLYCGLCVMGHMIFSLGVLLNIFWCALLGRLLAGVGSEALFLCTQLYSYQYFVGKELSMVICISFSVSSLGSSLVYFVSNPILNYVRDQGYGKQDFGIVLFIVGSFMTVSIVGSLFLAYMDPPKLEMKNNSGEKEKKINKSSQWHDMFLFSLKFWLAQMIEWSDSVWIYGFLPFSQDFFMSVHDMSVESANRVMSYFSIVGAISSPFIGIMIDKLGFAMIFSKAGLIAAFIAHFLLGFTTCSPYLSIFILSVSYGYVSGSVIPMAAYLVPEHKLGTACGITLAGMNVVFAFCAYLAGVIIDTYSYKGFEIFMLGSVAFGLIASAALMVLDQRSSGILNMTPSQRNRYLSKLKESEELKEPLKNETDVLQ